MNQIGTELISCWLIRGADTAGKWNSSGCKSGTSYLLH